MGTAYKTVYKEKREDLAGYAEAGEGHASILEPADAAQYLKGQKGFRRK